MLRKHNKELVYHARCLRKEMTKEEKHLWYDFLRTYPVRFLRQRVIDDYIADFYCSKARLVIELDGSQHFDEDAEQYDRIRTERLNQRNLTVIRITNLELKQNFRGVCETIDRYVCRALGRNVWED